MEGTVVEGSLSWVGGIIGSEGACSGAVLSGSSSMLGCGCGWGRITCGCATTITSSNRAKYLSDVMDLLKYVFEVALQAK